MRVQQATRRETGHILLGTLAFSVVMELVFFFIGRWGWDVVWGNLLGGTWAVFNFFLLGLTVQRIAEESDQKRAKAKLQGSYTLRMLLTIGVVVLAIQLPFMSWPAAAIPLLFPRLTILCMQMLGMYKPSTPSNQEGGDETV